MATPKHPPLNRRGERIAQIARRYLKKPNKLVRNDCSGLIITVLGELDIKVSGGTEHMWKKAVAEGRARQRPRVGDIAFFDNTWDRNKNGRVDDPFSHVALVVAVDGDQIEMVHKIPSGIKVLRANLSQPSAYKKRGAVLNDFLRAPKYGPKKGGRMAGELLRGFGSV